MHALAHVSLLMGFVKFCESSDGIELKRSNFPASHEIMGKAKDSQPCALKVLDSVQAKKTPSHPFLSELVEEMCSRKSLSAAESSIYSFEPSEIPQGRENPQDGTDGPHVALHKEEDLYAVPYEENVFYALPCEEILSVAPHRGIPHEENLSAIPCEETLSVTLREEPLLVISSEEILFAAPHEEPFFMIPSMTLPVMPSETISVISDEELPPVTLCEKVLSLSSHESKAKPRKKRILGIKSTGTESHSLPKLTLSELNDMTVKVEEGIADNQQRTPSSLTSSWLRTSNEQAKVNYTERIFHKIEEPRIVFLLAGHQKYQSSLCRLVATRGKYGINIKSNSFEISSELKTKAKKKKEADVSVVGGVVGKLEGNNLAITVSNKPFYRIFLYRSTLITELESGKPVPVQNDDILFMVPDGITGEMLKECLRDSSSYEEALDWLNSKYYKHYKRNADFIIARIGHC